jgi:hypothetical protein
MVFWKSLTAAAILISCMNMSCRPSSPSPGREQAIAAAKREAQKQGWKETEVGDVVFTNGHWEITIWRLPKTPGGLATVDVTADGKSVTFHPGE